MTVDPCPLNFLVVEDNDDHAFILFRCFPEEYRADLIQRVGNGKDAIAFLKRESPFEQAKRPGLILLDLKMPLMDGHETLAVIKNDPSLRDIPVIVLTTSEAESDVAKAYDLHANSYVTKPFEPKQMREMAEAIRKFWGVWNRTKKVS